MTYAYYPGCSAISSPELHTATKAVMSHLGMKWVALSEAACCGSMECGGLEVADSDLNLALNARTLAMAERAGVECIVVVCSTCQLKLTMDNQRLKADSALLGRINGAIGRAGYTYNGTVSVKHLIYAVLDDIGLERVRQLVKRPLKGFAIAPFYGCHLIRPDSLYGSLSGYKDDPYSPTSLKDLIETLGAEEVDYDGKTKCCGFHALMVARDTTLGMAATHIEQAQDKGADWMVTPCPLCHAVLDGHQQEASRKSGNDLRLPVLHLPQMLGVAMGLSPKDLGLNRHMIPIRAL